MTDLEGRDRIVFPAIILMLAFSIRVLWQIQVGMYTHPDVWESDDVARNLVEGRGFVFTFLGTDWLTYGTPAYPALLAALHAMGGGPRSYLLIGLLQSALSVGLGMSTYLIAVELADRRVAGLAAIVVLFHPALIVYSGKVHELTFEALAAAIVLAVALRSRDPRRRGRGFALGLAAGVSWLTRPTLAAVNAALFMLLWLKGMRRPLIVAAAIAIAVGAPWTIRNAIVLGPGATTAPFTCLTLWIGNNPNSSGGTLDREGRAVLPITDEMRPQLEGRPEQLQGRVFCEEAFAFLARDPVASVGWWLTKFGYFWWSNPHEGVLYPAGWIEAYMVLYAFEASLALVGIAAVWRRGDRSALAFVLVQMAVISLAQSFFYVDGRHRLLLEPTIASLAAAGTVWLYDRLRLRTLLRTARAHPS